MHSTVVDNDMIEAFGIETMAPMEMVRKARTGLGKRAAETLAIAMKISMADISRYLDVSPRTLQRKREGDVFSPAQSDHLLQIAKVFLRCEEIYEGREAARTWLQRKNRALGDIPPVSLLDTYSGIEMVMDELGRLEHGIIS